MEGRAGRRRRIARMLIPVVAAVSLVGAAAVAAPAEAAPPVTSLTFSNWAGYAVTRSGVTFSDVKGTFTVPAITCSAGTVTASSQWVGIDGVVSGATTVEQTGVESDCTGQGTGTDYYAWYEVYPDGLVLVPLTVRAGDVVTAEVTYLGGSGFHFALKDDTTGKSYSSPTVKAVSGFRRNSAEWVVERPDYPYANISDFRAVTFSAASATGNGHAGAIASSYWNLDDITMESKGATVPVATASTLNSAGNAFTVTHQNPCPRCT